jgi:hypothetical protein
MHAPLQTEEEVLDAPFEDKIYNIPPDIRPGMVSYRLEVIFWGVRDMRKIKGTLIRRPRIIVECAGVHVNSDIMNNAQEFSNFQEPHIMIDLVILKSFIADMLDQRMLIHACALSLSLSQAER